MRMPTLPSFSSFPERSAGCRAPRKRICPVEPVELEKICRSCRRNRQGAAAVEFAIVAPIFFLLIFGMIEFGRMVMVQQIITNASREGARVGVLDGAVRVGTETSPGVVDSVERYLENARIDPDSATITVDPYVPSSAGYGEPVTVTVAIPFDQVSWLPSPFFLSGETDLTATTVMRRETVQ